MLFMDDLFIEALADFLNPLPEENVYMSKNELNAYSVRGKGLNFSFFYLVSIMVLKTDFIMDDGDKN